MSIIAHKRLVIDKDWSITTYSKILNLQENVLLSGLWSTIQFI